MQSHPSIRATTLVLLPGLDGTGDLFAPLLAALPTQWTAHVVRYPPRRPLGYAELTALVRAALPQDGRFVLLGESFSGPIAIQVAAQRPAGLTALILCATFATGARPGLRWTAPLLRVVPLQAIARWLAPLVLMGSSATAPLRGLLRAALRRVASQVLATRIAATLRVNVARELGEVTVPVLYLRATRDRLLSRSACEGVVRAAPATRVADIAGPHCLLQCVPGDAVLAIEQFVATLH